jgi:putative tryptophan/tyrosine transport system substrate-binding protein
VALRHFDLGGRVSGGGPGCENSNNENVGWDTLVLIERVASPFLSDARTATDGRSRFMKRRDFIVALGAAAAMPRIARAQERVRRIGVLTNLRPDDAEIQSRLTVFASRLEQIGWSIGRDLQIDYRWSEGDSDRLRTHAAELVALGPDVTFATSGVSILPLQQASQSIPIVFAQTIDPVGLGVVDSLSRPGGNVTGFTQFEYGITSKWLDLLKRIAPGVTRASVLRDPFDPAGIGQWAAMQSVAPTFGLELSVINVRDPQAIESSMLKISTTANTGLLVTASAPANVHRTLILGLAARYHLPAVYPYRYFVTAGGLTCYGPDTIDQYRRAAGYVDRILKGEKPADMPVQAPTKFDLVINLKTANALGLAISPEMLAIADEVIE